MSLDFSTDPQNHRKNLSALKETEIGLLPAEWNVIKLGKVAHINLGQSPPSSTYNTIGDGLPFLQGKTTFGRVFPTPERWCSAPKRIAEPGSVLISVRAPVGDVNIAQDKYCIGRGLTSLNGKACLDNWFLFYLLIFSKPRLESKSTGSTFKSINKGILKSFPIPHPSLPEQRRIAGALRIIQEAIAVQEDVIAAARELKHSLMERLFTYGPGAEHAPTKETEIGEIPEHWTVIHLGHIAQVNYGKTRPKTEGKIPVIGSGGIYAWTDKALVNFSTVIIGRKGSAGEVWLMDKPCWPSDTTFYLKLKEDIDVYFLYNYLKRNPLSGEHAKTTLPSLQRPDLENQVIPLPPLPEQHRIANVLHTTQKSIAAEEQRKSALEEVFRSTLEQLMTGQIRLREEPIEKT